MQHKTQCAGPGRVLQFAFTKMCLANADQAKRRDTLEERNIDSVEYATLQWLDWFNNRRLLEPIGHVPPAEYEKAYYDDLERQAIAA
jgi:hypothetical protein